jgi:hypothetical protein
VQNWVGEETAALVRRSAWDKVGLFNTGLSTYMDIDMWLRLFFFADVGFVDDDLATYRHHDKSVTAGIARPGRAGSTGCGCSKGSRATPRSSRRTRSSGGCAARRSAGRAPARRPHRARPTPSGVGEYATFRFRGSPKAQLYPPLTRDRASATAA